MNQLFLCTLIGLSLTFPSVSFAQAKLRSLDIKSFNKKIVAGYQAKKPWTQDPLLIALELAGAGTEEMASKKISVANDSPEVGNNQTLITIVEDGWLDDSQRGHKRIFKMHKNKQGQWRIQTAQEAYSCWRGPTKGFTTKPCP